MGCHTLRSRGAADDGTRRAPRRGAAATGLDDFGDDSFLEGLERLVRSLRDEASMNAVGEAAVPYLIVNLLTHRLQIEEWYRRHPEIDDELIRTPLIGLGLPRTGETDGMLERSSMRDKIIWP